MGRTIRVPAVVLATGAARTSALSGTATTQAAAVPGPSQSGHGDSAMRPGTDTAQRASVGLPAVASGGFFVNADSGKRRWVAPP